MTPYEQGFISKCAELGVGSADGHSAVIPVSEYRDYLAKQKAVDTTQMPNPLKHIAVGGIGGASLGAAAAALGGGRGSDAGAGAVLGGLAGIGIGAASGAVAAIRAIVRQRRRRNALYEAFAKAHGLDPNRQLYATATV